MSYKQIEEIKHRGKLYQISQDSESGIFFLYHIKYIKTIEKYLGAGKNVEDCRKKLGVKDYKKPQIQDDKQLAFKFNK